jgi:hypothetical protein
MTDLRFCRSVWMKPQISWEGTLHCASSSWCFGEMLCLFVVWSTATNGTLGLPDSENETVQSFESYLPGDKVSHTRRLVYSVKCGVKLFSSFSVDSCVMNVLERAYNCFLINYKARIWGFVSSGILKSLQVQELAPMHSEDTQWLHPEGFLLTQKKSSLEHEGSVFL